MRLFGTSHTCGPLIELGWLTRQLNLGAAIPEGVETIAVDQVIGTVQRGRDFDGCWHPLNPRLKKLIDDIEAAAPSALDDPIDVVRVDQAYFVTDGHKRIALAHRTGREFIDARISRVATPYAVTSDLDEDEILRTAREGEFRRHSGLEVAFPDTRFVLSEIDAYGELYAAVRAHAFAMAEAAGTVVPWPDVARDWYESDFRPLVESTRAEVGTYVESLTDADIYVAIHRQRLAWWGSECDAIECAAQQLLTERKLEATRRRSILDGLLGQPSEPTPSVLPLSTDDSR